MAREGTAGYPVGSIDGLVLGQPVVVGDGVGSSDGRTVAGG